MKIALVEIQTHDNKRDVHESDARIELRPGHTARTLLERSLNGRERGPNFDNARHRAQNGEKKNRKHGRCLSGAPLKPALL